MKTHLVCVILVTFLFLPTTHANPLQELCQHPELKSFSILHQGRVKPLVVLAEDIFKFMSGSSNPFAGESASESFCQLSFAGLLQTPSRPLNFKVEHPDIQRLLQIEGPLVSLEKLTTSEESLRMEWMRQKENNGYKKELGKISQRLQLYRDLIQGEMWKIPLSTRDYPGDWLPLTQYLSKDRIEGHAGGLTGLMLEAQKTFEKTYPQATTQTEFLYWKMQPFLWALILCGLALFVGFASPLHWAVAGAIAVLGLETFGLTLRVLISHRAPITNMYETVLFSGYGALFLATIVSLWRKEKIYVLGGLAYNMMCLMMMKFAHGMLDPAISPLVPVLRDNFWLSTHVTTIILSYAALALSWVLANMYLLKNLVSRCFPQKVLLDATTHKTEEQHFFKHIYLSVQIGVVLLAAGVILGGIWADYSWGRFWGWDPKETWSLIVLVVYMIILHGRYTQWISPARFIPLIAGAFMSVMMAWFGVNYILATGLHSYGFSEGGALFLGSFFALQILILILSQLSSLKKVQLEG